MEPLELLSPAQFKAVRRKEYRFVRNAAFEGMPSNEPGPEFAFRSITAPRVAPQMTLLEFSTQRLRARLFEYDSALDSVLRSQTDISDRTTSERSRRSHEERIAKLQNFAGRWVVLENDEVVSSGDTAADAARAARANGIAVPYLLFVEPRSHDTAKIGL